MGGVDALDRVAILVHVVRAQDREAEDVEREGARLPGFVEDRLVALPLDRAEAAHAAETVNAVHASLHTAPITAGPAASAARRPPAPPRPPFVTDSERMPEPAARCWSCNGPIDDADRYCRHCGQGRGAALAWYYRPFWIVVLALTALGPFVLPLVWRTPRLDRPAKWVATIVVLVVSAYLAWEFVATVRQLGDLLGGGDVSLT